MKLTLLEREHNSDQMAWLTSISSVTQEQDQPQLYNKLEASLGNRRPLLKSNGKWGRKEEKWSRNSFEPKESWPLINADILVGDFQEFCLAYLCLCLLLLSFLLNVVWLPLLVMGLFYWGNIIGGSVCSHQMCFTCVVAQGWSALERLRRIAAN